MQKLKRLGIAVAIFPLFFGNMKVFKFWDAETGTCKHPFDDYGFIVRWCSWFLEPKRIAYGSSVPEKGIYMWDCDDNEIKAWKGMRMPKHLFGRN